VFGLVVEDWMDDAECQFATNPEIFFPEYSREDRKTARSYCYRCPVSDQCLEYALRYNIQHGIFAGLLPDERRAIKNRRKREQLPKCG